MKKLIRSILPLLMLAGLLTLSPSCHLLNPNNMLHAGRNYHFDTLQKDSAYNTEFRLGPNDIIEFRLFANDGFKMVDIISMGNGGSPGNNTILRQGFEYSLDKNGAVKLPIIGIETLSGLTVREAELLLEKRYSEYYVKPFVMLKVINRRVVVFTGEPGQAKVLTISNNNTTVLEAIAQAGGISATGKAYNVKLIRKTNDPKKPYKVYKMDLSRIQTGLVQGNTVVQSDDVIYVEPRMQLATKALREITPILSLTTSLITFYYLLTRL
jgi:polysaccharide export outer membrane protein